MSGIYRIISTSHVTEYRLRTDTINTLDYSKAFVLAPGYRVWYELICLQISDGPEYNIFLYAEIEKPLYHFTCMDYDFGKCFVNAPDSTYKKNIAFCNNDKTSLTYVN